MSRRINEKLNSNMNTNKTRREEMEEALLDNYGPAEKRGLSVMIPISSIWRWFKKIQK